MVGDFEPGVDDPTTGLGAAVIENAIALMAAVHKKFTWDPADYKLGEKGLHFHRDCARDHHACPGSLVNKANVVARVRAAMGLNGEIPTPTPEPPQPVDVEIPAWPPANDPFFERAETVRSVWASCTDHEPLIMAGVANAEAETAFNTEAVGDHGSAHGLYQWHGDRVKWLLENTKVDVTTAELSAQVLAAYQELRQRYPKTLEKLLATATAAEAAQIFCAEYEGAGAPNATQRRSKMAERWSAYFARHSF
jgi:hypothetical protein